MSNSVAPSPISSSGVNATRSVGRGSSGMRGQVRDRRHDLRDARLVVGAEQRVAAAGDDVVADLRGQLRHRRRVEPRAAARQLDHAAVVVAVDDRLDAGAGRVGAGVDVGDQADDVAIAAAAPLPASVAIT